MSDNRARSISCPFCKEKYAELLPNKKASMVSWQKIRGRAIKRYKLNALQCDNCGIIVFKGEFEE